MLRVQRHRPAPQFFEETEIELDRLISWAKRNPQDRRQFRAPINHDLFRSGFIVDKIAKEFNGRCAFCERAINSSEGIGHFRPFTIEDSNRILDLRDHYAWLAYEWLNLFLICERCRRAKGDSFPVANDKRAPFLAVYDEVKAIERPVLIDPTSENPAASLTYLTTGHCVARHNSNRANVTIDVFNLNGDDLVHSRSVAVKDSLSTFMDSIESRRAPPADFLGYEPFAGACREVIIRALGDEFGQGLSTNKPDQISTRIRTLINNGVPEYLDRLLATADSLLKTDLRRVEETFRPRPPIIYGASSPARPRATASPFSSRGSMRSIRILNFRAIDDLQFDMQLQRREKYGSPCMLLLGENAVGKSTILNAIALALIGKKQADRLGLSYHEMARSVERNTWDLWNHKKIEVSIDFQHSRERAEFIYDPLRRLVDGSENQSAVVLGYGPHRYFEKARSNWTTSPADRVRSLFNPKHPLPDPTDWLNSLDGDEFYEVARTIRTILPTAEDELLVRDQRSGICVNVMGQLTPVVQLSEGYRSVFAMVGDICRSLLAHWSNLEKAEAVVLIDEIETHLHPRWKMKVLGSLREAFPQVQFITTSHDPLCVRGMDNGEVMLLSQTEDGGVHIVPDLPDVSGMSAEQLLSSEYFGLFSTIEPDIHLRMARIADGLSAGTIADASVETDRLVSKLTIGDDVTAQIIHEALKKFVREAESRDPNVLATARPEAVAAVFNALKKARMAG